MKVYLATSGEYSDYQVLHVFAREADASAYPLADDVREMELREGPVDVRTSWALTWWHDKPDQEDADQGANPVISSHLEDYDDARPAVHHLWVAHGRYLQVTGWDRDRVLKVYSEQRAQYKAREAGMT